MNRERIIKANVRSMRSKYKLSKVTLDNLVYIIEDQGFEIIEYDSTEDSTENHLIDSLNLRDYISGNKAFTYQCGILRYVFLSDELTAEEKLYALAHEVGHIFCGHLKEGNILYSVEEEYEANEFAHAILHPPIWGRIIQLIMEHKRKVCVVAVALIVACGVVIGITYNEKQAAYIDEYYITSSGHKYHRADCIFIKNKSNIERLTKKEYSSGEYEPCQICLPNDK